MKNGAGQKLSERVSSVLDRMDEVNSSYANIEKVIKDEFITIHNKLNPEREEEITREINHHFNSNIAKLLKSIKADNY